VFVTDSVCSSVRLSVSIFCASPLSPGKRSYRDVDDDDDDDDDILGDVRGAVILLTRRWSPSIPYQQIVDIAWNNEIGWQLLWSWA